MPLTITATFDVEYHLGGWRFDFTDVVHLYWVKQFGHISEYYAVDKTALRSILHETIDEIVELI